MAAYGCGTRSDEQKIDGLTALLRPFGVREMVQTGAIALPRGAEASSQKKDPGASREAA